MDSSSFNSLNISPSFSCVNGGRNVGGEKSKFELSDEQVLRLKFYIREIVKRHFVKMVQHAQISTFIPSNRTKLNVRDNRSTSLLYFFLNVGNKTDAQESRSFECLPRT